MHANEIIDPYVSFLSFPSPFVPKHTHLHTQGILCSQGKLNIKLSKLSELLKAQIYYLSKV